MYNDIVARTLFMVMDVAVVDKVPVNSGVPLIYPLESSVMPEPLHSGPNK